MRRFIAAASARRVAWRHHKTILSVDYSVAAAGRVGGDDGAAGRHSLQDAAWNPLAIVGRQHEDRARGKIRSNVRGLAEIVDHALGRPTIDLVSRNRQRDSDRSGRGCETAPWDTATARNVRLRRIRTLPSPEGGAQPSGNTGSPAGRSEGGKAIEVDAGTRNGNDPCNVADHSSGANVIGVRVVVDKHPPAALQGDAVHPGDYSPDQSQTLDYWRRH